MKRIEIAAVVPALGTSLLPSLSCPACWPAYGSVLSAVGLSFLGESKYLLWLNAATLGVSLIVLFRRARHASYVPVSIGALAVLFIFAGKFWWNSNPVNWLGGATLLVAFVWSRSRPKPAGCAACVGNTSLVGVNHGIKES